MTEIDEVVRRLEALEEAVARMRPGVTGGEAEEAEQDDVFWALDGVRSRAPEGGMVLYAGSVGLVGGGTAEWQYARASADMLEADWSVLAPRLAALGHPVRLRILRAVLAGTSTVSALVDELGEGTSGQVYHHLKELAAAGWVVSGSRGVHTVPPERVVPLLAAVLAAGAS